MAAGEKCYLLNFRSVIDAINDALDATSFNRFSYRQPFHIDEYLLHLFNWLGEQILDKEATSYSDIAAGYLKRLGMPEEQATIISHNALNDIVALITECFPRISIAELSQARYQLDVDDVCTLLVFIKD